MKKNILITGSSGLIGSDAVSFFAEQDVSAVARAHAPDRVVLGKMEDQPTLDVQIRLAVEALGELAAGAELLEHGGADVGHGPHVQHDVNAVGQLDADLAEGGADRAHRERDHVHRPPPHRALEDLARPPIPLLGGHPVVRRAGVLAERRADVGQVLGPRHVVQRGPVVQAPGKLLLIQRGHFPSRRGLLNEAVLLFGGSVDPDDVVGLAEVSHLLDPFLKFPVLVHVLT